MIGFASISLECLEVSEHQVRPVQDWFVNSIVNAMENFTDYSYQPYCVLTKDISDKTKWSENKVSLW